MTTNPTVIDPAKLAEITHLYRGSHFADSGKYCLMEAAAYVHGDEHTDRPACVSPVLSQMGRSLNDLLPDDSRQRLVPLIPDLPGTADDGLDEQRGYMALDWLVRTWLPAWLDLAPACREDAAKVRELDRITDSTSAERAGSTVRRACDSARAARAAARAAAWAAAWAAAGAAAGAAAWAAAGEAAGEALAPTVERLQVSAIELYERMVRLGSEVN